MKHKVKASNLEGVTISVVSYASSFNVFIDIDEGCNFAKKRKNKYFSIKFNSDGMSPIAQEEFHLKLRHQEYPSSNFVVHFKRTISMPNGMPCVISLAPEFYLSHELLKHCKKQQAKGLKTAKKKKEKKAEEKIIARFYRDAEYGRESQKSSSQAKLNGRLVTNYSMNNIVKPYQGGGCSSK